MNRRSLLLGGGAILAARPLGAAYALPDNSVELPFANGARPLVAYPGKRPLIRLTSRPPQLETPFPVFDEGPLTPNDAFFVRYHLSDIPRSIDPETHRISVAGKVERPFSIGLHELETAFEPVEIVAVAECSGNSRGFFDPRVGGGQLANGAMGNARWRGVSLKSILERAGIQAGARQIVFNGLDQPPSPATPDFIKALDVDHAMDGEVMIAYEMNGQELPWLNGYPVRLVAPGYYATYWVKHLSDIQVVADVWDGFWMKTAYRIPDNACACAEPGQPARATTPIKRLNVRSFVTNLTDGSIVRAGREIVIKGVAFDGGYGVSAVLLSIDGGKSWTETRLGTDMGRYSFREWTTPLRLDKGEYKIMVRAINRIGQSQPSRPLWNPQGYMRNSVEPTRILAQ